MSRLDARLDRLEKGDLGSSLSRCLDFVDQLGRDIPDLQPESEAARLALAQTVHERGGPKHFVENVLAEIDGFTATI